MAAELEKPRRQEMFSGVKPVIEAHRFGHARLEAYMQANVEGFRAPLEIVEFKGGQSNPTYRLTDGNGTRYVLRRKPPGKLLPSAHAVDREYRVITALAGTGVPVARTYALCTDESVIGTWFFIMEYVEGRVLWEIALPDQTPEERGEIYDSLNRTIAALHAVDYEAVGLGGYGRPGNYVARQVSRWTKQFLASEVEPMPVMHKLASWLAEHVPEDEETSIIHGDFRIDNTILHPTENRVVAVLDWELSTLGNPLSDFNYHCMPWRQPMDPFEAFFDRDLETWGIPSEEDYVRRYCERTGRKEIPNWEFYHAFNMFRLAAILVGIRGRIRDGTAASEHAMEQAERAFPLADLAWSIARKVS